MDNSTIRIHLHKVRCPKCRKKLSVPYHQLSTMGWCRYCKYFFISEEYSNVILKFLPIIFIAIFLTSVLIVAYYTYPQNDYSRKNTNILLSGRFSFEVNDSWDSRIFYEVYEKPTVTKECPYIFTDINDKSYKELKIQSLSSLQDEYKDCDVFLKIINIPYDSPVETPLAIPASYGAIAGSIRDSTGSGELDIVLENPEGFTVDNCHYKFEDYVSLNGPGNKLGLPPF